MSKTSKTLFFNKTVRMCAENFQETFKREEREIDICWFFVAFVFFPCLVLSVGRETTREKEQKVREPREPREPRAPNWETENLLGSRQIFFHACYLNFINYKMFFFVLFFFNTKINGMDISEWIKNRRDCVNISDSGAYVLVFC